MSAGFVFQFFGGSYTLRLARHHAIRVGATYVPEHVWYNPAPDDNPAMLEVDGGWLYYPREAFSGGFLEANYVHRTEKDRVSQSGPAGLMGWHWRWRNGFTIAMAIGVGVRLQGRIKNSVLYNGYLRVGYAF